jgi:hypothetical protein
VKIIQACIIFIGASMATTEGSMMRIDRSMSRIDPSLPPMEG